MADPVPRRRRVRHKANALVVGDRTADTLGNNCWLWDPETEDGFIMVSIETVIDEHRAVVRHVSFGTREVPVASLFGVVNNERIVANNTDLIPLNTATVFRNMKLRYVGSDIHTASGAFLCVINPYARFENKYNSAVMRAYRKGPIDRLEPHVYAVAAKAYAKLRKEGRNQSILITGESGAGKTENTKFVIKYLALNPEARSDGGSGAAGSRRDNLENRIIGTNPLLEAFGNAKTVRNDNSSRFGKFIKIEFSQGAKIVGARIETYLLEKSRVMSHGRGEGNFHIFYQLLEAGDDAKRSLQRSLGLEGELLSPAAWAILRPSDGSPPADRARIADADDWTALCNALIDLDVAPAEQMRLWHVTAAILHLGNVGFSRGRSDDSLAIADPDGHLGVAARLLGVDAAVLEELLLRPTTRMGNRVQVRSHASFGTTPEGLLGSLCKTLYEMMFARIEFVINAKISDVGGGGGSDPLFVGVLDISGFEVFEKNTLEQLLINYTNERLQRFFNENAFDDEQRLYKAEGIDWVQENYGNSLNDSINVLEGVIRVLKDNGHHSFSTAKVDASVATEMANSNTGNPAYIPSHALNTVRDRVGGPLEFGVKHYAGPVIYDAAGWVTMNKGYLVECLTDLLRSSPDLGPLFESFGAGAADEGSSSTRGESVGAKSTARYMANRHWSQLEKLMLDLGRTEAQFIRCIKPNEAKRPNLLDGPMVVRQLVYSGVVEGIDIMLKGFPTRFSYEEFQNRYAILLDDIAFREDGPAPEGGRPTSVLDRSGFFVKGSNERIDHDVVVENCRVLLAHLDLGFADFGAPIAADTPCAFGRTRLLFRMNVLREAEERLHAVLQARLQVIALVARKTIRRRNRPAGGGNPALLAQLARSFNRRKRSPWEPIFREGALIIREIANEARMRELMREHEDHLVEMQEVIGQLNQNVERANAEIRRLTSDLGAARDEADQAYTDLEAERSEVKRLLDVVADRDAAAKIAAATIAKLEARVEALTAELAAANSEVARLQDELDVLKGALAVSQEEGRALEHDVETLEADKAVDQAELARLQTELADVNQRLTDIVDSLGGGGGGGGGVGGDGGGGGSEPDAIRLIREGQASLNARIGELEAERDGLRADIKDKTDAIFVLEEEALKTAARIADLEAKQTEAAATLIDCQAELEAVTGRRDALEADAEAGRTEMESVAADLVARINMFHNTVDGKVGQVAAALGLTTARMNRLAQQTMVSRARTAPFQASVKKYQDTLSGYIKASIEDVTVGLKATLRTHQQENVPTGFFSKMWGNTAIDIDVEIPKRWDEACDTIFDKFRGHFFDRFTPGTTGGSLESNINSMVQHALEQCSANEIQADARHADWTMRTAQIVIGKSTEMIEDFLKDGVRARLKNQLENEWYTTPAYDEIKNATGWRPRKLGDLINTALDRWLFDSWNGVSDDWDAVSLDFKRKFDEHVIRLVAAEAMLRFLNPGDMTPRAADTPPAADDFDFT